MKKFYFTYGTSKSYPFRGGWTEVIAPNRSMAIGAFNAVHPPQVEDIINCSFVYDETTFKTFEMYKNGNLGARCHERITISIEHNPTDEVDTDVNT